MTEEIGYGTRVQYLTYWVRAEVNTGTAAGVAASARASNKVLDPKIGQLTLDGKLATALLTTEIATAHQIQNVLATLQSELSAAVTDGSTLTRETSAPSIYTWENTLVTSGISKKSITTYDYGNRSQDIKVTSSYRLIGSGRADNLVDGVFGSSATDGVQLRAVDVQNQWLTFDFGADHKVIVDEVIWQLSGSDLHGKWVWQGSNDGASYHSLGDSFTLGGDPTQVQTALKDNEGGYRFYRLLGVSGTATTQMHEQVFFKSVADFPATASVVENLSAQSVNLINDKVRNAVAAIDNLVSSGEYNGVNLLSSTGRSIDIQTGQFGGKMSISTVPMDAKALGLSNLRAGSESEGFAALKAVDDAMVLTRVKIAELFK